MRFAVLFVMAVLMAGSAFAVSDAVKQCVKSCCENSGGTYDYASNGCTNPGQGSFECSMACQQGTPKPASCFGAALLFSLVGISSASLMMRR